jgi:hypothetical protein
MATKEGRVEGQGVAAGREDLLERAATLLEEAGALKEHYRKLSKSLDELGAESPDPAPARPEAEVRPVEEEMRVAAANLFLSGSRREEVAAYLAETFGSTDTEALLDEFQAKGGRRRRRRFRRGS